MPAEEVTTEPLGIEQLQAMVPSIIRFLSAWGRDRVEVKYGYACNLPIDQLWRPIEVETLLLEAFVQRSVRDGVFQFGQCDLHIEDPAHTLEFKLSHESDIYFASTDRSLVDQVTKAWHEQGLVLYLSEGPQGSAAPKHWRRIDPALPANR